MNYLVKPPSRANQPFGMRAALGLPSLAIAWSGAMLAACSASGDRKQTNALEVTPAPAAVFVGSAKESQLKEWHTALSKTRPPKTGCFHSSYPSTDWVEVPCAPVPGGVSSPRPPARRLSERVPPAPNAPARGLLPSSRDTEIAPFVASNAPSNTRADDVGGGTDWFAVLTGEGQITQTSGSFPFVSSGIALSTGYSIQMNTNPFEMAYDNNLCNDASDRSLSKCDGWQQAVYSAAMGGLFFQYVFLGAGPNCPPGGWYTTSGDKSDCYLKSATVSGVPNVGIADLSSMKLTFAPGDNDYLMMTIEGTAYSDYFPSVLGVSGWNNVQFGVYGDDDGDEALFTNPDTSIVAEIDTLKTGGTIGCSLNQGCSGDDSCGSTAESSNLSLVSDVPGTPVNCCLANPEATGISFQESYDVDQGCRVCGGEGQSCCGTGYPCASGSDVCSGGTCVPCGNGGEPCCTVNAANNACNPGNVCQLGFCGAPNVFVASPSSLSVTAGDGTSGANTAVTNFVASGFWLQDGQVAPSLPPTAFCVTSTPTGGALPCGTMPTGIAQPVITNDINPPTVQFSADQTAATGTYSFAVTGTLNDYQATATMTLNVAQCQPVTCAESGWVCDSFDDGCGGTSSCGTCPSGESCTGGACYTCAERSCPSPEYFNPATCKCEGCPCGEIRVDGKWICAACKG